MSSKQVFREGLKAVLSKIPAIELDKQSVAITNAVLPLVQQYQSVACYMNMDNSEVKTHDILRRLFLANKTVYLPRCTNTKVTGQISLRPNKKNHPHLTFHKMQSWEQVQNLTPQGKYKLKEPPEETPMPMPPQLDVILVPGVGFSLNGGKRIGHGAGFYDDFFQRYQLHHNGEKPLLIGIALKEQLIDDIPTADHDYSMDCIVVGDGSVHWFK
ncbi:hypothetical protein NCAS_0B07850 [Naumovozyma castellii]|uniref:5-formyltetrahydrofolate cyclo-ligase n=1 Tax=Naumovozyma castellii TaxID=27288 RepID=G0VAD9_NAUCA|nr:hypothetical protein NCAS_0B07850 [Naumovozyma castellii CBS 4309]CCC68869.1 hypothetical protein NCAS_0B07850 [Naumovozyma castellii CBS 4309]